MENTTAFKGTSFRADIKFVILYKDEIGWKLDAYSVSGSPVPNGDTYQDSFDEMMPFLKFFVDGNSKWKDYDTGEETTLWNILDFFTSELDDDHNSVSVY